MAATVADRQRTRRADLAARGLKEISIVVPIARELEIRGIADEWVAAAADQTSADRPRDSAQCTAAEFDALLMHPDTRILPHSCMASALKQVLVEGVEIAAAARLAGLSTAGQDRGPRTVTNGRRGLQRELKRWQERLQELRALDGQGAQD